jgi:hypothetical protein
MERTWSRLILIFIFALITLVICSCDANKQLARLIKKHPELVRDTTLTDYDTTVFHVPAVRKDSVVHISSFMTDTIYLKQDRLSVKTYVYNDSVYIEGECAEIIDTVFSVEQIQVPYVVNSPKQEASFWVMIAVAVLLLLNILIRRGRNQA